MAPLRQTSILQYIWRCVKDGCVCRTSSFRQNDNRHQDNVESSVQTTQASSELIKKALREDPKVFEHMDDSIFKVLFGKTKKQFRKTIPTGRKHYFKILRDCKLRPGRAIYEHRRCQLRKLKNRRKAWREPGKTPLQQSWAVGHH